MNGTGIWFVTPAWQRFELTAVCLEQRRRVIEALGAKGIEAHCVVVADDENLDIARACGFDTVETPNDWLDTKFNDGMQWAGEHDARWIVPIGSDSWIDPGYFLPLPLNEGTRTSRMYAVVEADRLVECDVHTAAGAGPYVFHRHQLERCGFRPAGDGKRTRGIDGATIAGILASGQRIHWRRVNAHPLQYVGFRGIPHLTPYERLRTTWGRRERLDPWPQLARIYPADLVERARVVLEAQTAVAA